VARRAANGSALIERLNQMVAELIKSNRRLKREVEKLSERRPAAARSPVKRSSRTTKRVQRAPKKTVTSKHRKTAAAPKPKRKIVAPRRRKTTR
jgi:hypothetical protein